MLHNMITASDIKSPYNDKMCSIMIAVLHLILFCLRSVYCLGGVMVGMLALSVVDSRFDT